MRSSGMVIQFDDVSKCYNGLPPTLLRTFSRFFTPSIDSAGNGSGGKQSEFWAIRHLSFEVEHGETLGIIGSNGAGKSTILKLIAGITAPTTGRLAVEGRVGSLIELGAGFNQDLTGRENIYLNAAVLGLTRREIEQRFDRIVAFSGLKDFLDTPVKYYSSGMYARLGFAIAVHVEADILLTDEILAVGDAAFQRQCYEKFQDLKTSTTIVLVSHDLARVKEICTRVLWINEGCLERIGKPNEVVDAYLEFVRLEREQKLKGIRPLGPEPGVRRWGSGEIEIVKVTTHDAHGQPRTVFRTCEDLIVRICYQVHRPFRDPGFGVKIHAADGTCIHATNTFMRATRVAINAEAGSIEVRYSKLPLLAGQYWLTVGVASENNWSAPYDVREFVQHFEIVTTHPNVGFIVLDHEWSVTGYAC